MNYGEKSKYGVVTSWCTLKTDNIFESSKVMPYKKYNMLFLYGYATFFNWDTYYIVTTSNYKKKY